MRKPSATTLRNVRNSRKAERRAASRTSMQRDAGQVPGALNQGKPRIRTDT